MRKEQISSVTSLLILGAMIRDSRKEADLNQTELAEMTGLHLKTISSLERGVTNLGIENLIRILSALGLELKIDKVPKSIEKSW